MKTLKLIRFALMITVLFAAILACSKDDNTPEESEPTINESLEGFWLGKYSYTFDEPPTPGYGMLFRTDGTVRVYDMESASDTITLTEKNKADGTYKVMQDQVEIIYISPPSYPFSAEANIDADFNEMEGTWGSNGGTNGTFFLVKQE